MQGKSESEAVGKYEIIGILGRGSMGVVYKARDPEIGRVVAVKVLRKIPALEALGEGAALERFKAEARSAGNLRHPHIVTLFEVNSEGENPYLVMDYIEGVGLDVIISERGKLEPGVAVHYLSHIAAGLDHAHEHGVIHRDIKPSNIHIDRKNTAFILDFGVASINGANSGEPIMGSPGYMSPEQILNQELDHRTDLFSLGIVAFQCFAGQRPFPGKNFTEVAGNILSAKPLSLTELVPELSLALEAEVERALAKKREQRFSSAQQMVAAFQEALGLTAAAHSGSKQFIVKGSAFTRPRRESEWQSFASSEGDTDQQAKGESDICQETQVGPAPVTVNEERIVARIGGYPPAGSEGSMGRRSPGEIVRRDEVMPRAGMPQQTHSRVGLRPVFIAIAAIALGVVMILFAATGNGPPAPMHPPGSQSSATTAGDGSATVGTGAARPERRLEDLSNGELRSLLQAGEVAESDLISAFWEAKRRGIDLTEVAQYPLQHDSSVVRLEGVKVISASGDRRLVPYVVERLDDYDPTVRIEAARTLGRLGDRGALSYLSNRLVREDSSAVRSAIQRSINDITGVPR